jgi:glycosyltransferase involved in cell wall biosynthesis
MRYSVIVPTYNRKTLLGKCLDSLANQDYPSGDYEIIVVDDGSVDGTRRVVESAKKGCAALRYFRTRHQGQGAARNVGLRKAKGEFIAFTDDDCVVEKEWLKKIEAAFRRSTADAVGGAIVNPMNRYIAWAQYILNFSAWLPKGGERYVKDIPTANICYSKQAIRDHFFPEHLGSGVYEDSLYNYKLHRKSKKILFCPAITVYHHTWEQSYGLRKFFDIQKKAGLGFLRGGYQVHGMVGHLLMRLKALNLFCPRLLMVFGRCVKYGYLSRFVASFPLLLSGELYRNLVIVFPGSSRQGSLT